MNLLFTPIQSRLIGPELIGFQQSLTSMIGIIIVFTTLKVETLMMHTVNINDQEKYAHAALSLAVRMSIVFGFFISIYWFYTNNQGIATLVAMMIVVPIILFLFAVDNVRKVQQIRNNQAKQYYRLSFLRNSFKNLLLVIIPVLTKISFIIILLIEVIYRIPGFFVQLRKMNFKGFNEKVMHYLIANPKVTYIYSFSLLINSVTAGWPLILIQQKDPNSGGEYAMYFRLFALPAMLISTYFSEQFSSSAKTKKQLSLYLILLMGISSVFCLAMMIIPSQLYKFILGNNWGGVFDFAFHLSTSLSLEIIFSAVSIYLILDNSMNFKYFIDLVLLMVSIIPFFLNFKLSDQILIMNMLKSISLAVFILFIYKNHIHSRVWNSRDSIA